ncbi:diguanylate cyclase [Candidatus Peregrinibacteria bacterium]|nr:diguanylate cyclase [Candidatus Peregrinibacteria bacterium]
MAEEENLPVEKGEEVESLTPQVSTEELEETRLERKEPVENVRKNVREEVESVLSAESIDVLNPDAVKDKISKYLDSHPDLKEKILRDAEGEELEARYYDLMKQIVSTTDSFIDTLRKSNIEINDALVEIYLDDMIVKTCELESARSEAMTDSLTGVLTRRAFSKRFDQELAESEREGTELSYAIVDLDDFKKINDEFGHDVGDKVLKKVAVEITKNVRKSDVVARYGGDEFVILFPGVTKELARSAAQRIAESVSKNPVDGARVTLSIGISGMKNVRDVEKLGKDADKRMYLIKQKRRESEKYRGGVSVDDRLSILENGEWSESEAA